jgi:hypothetical protein
MFLLSVYTRELIAMVTVSCSYSNKSERQVRTVEQNQSGIGTGTIVLSFITGLAVGIAAVLLINANKEKTSNGDEHDDQLFI